MTPTKPILRMQALVPGTPFVIDAWNFFSYKAGSGGSVTVTNSLGDTFNDSGSGSMTNEFPNGMDALTFTAVGAAGVIMYIGNKGAIN